MRTLEEINLEVDKARATRDHRSLCDLADELISQGTEKASLIAENCRGTASLYIGDYHTALRHFQEALRIATILHDSSASVTMQGNIAIVHSSTGAHELALSTYKSVLNAYETTLDLVGLARTLNNMGIAQWRLGELHDALASFMRAQEINAELGRTQELADNACNLALIYSALGDVRNARESYERGIDLYTQSSNRSGLATVWGNLGTLHIATGAYDSALTCFHTALDLHEELGETHMSAKMHVNIGVVHNATADYPLAMKHFRSALEVFEATEDRSMTALIEEKHGTVYYHSGEYDVALACFQRALDLYSASNERVGMANVLGSMASVLHAQGERDRALELHSQALQFAIAVDDSAAVARHRMNIIGLYLDMQRTSSAEALLHEQESSLIIDPETLSAFHLHKARLSLFHEDIEASHTSAHQALSIAMDRGARSVAVEVLAFLCELSRARNDFDGYVNYSTEHRRINEEIRGQEATRKLAMIEAEKRIAAERAEKDKHRALLYNTLPPAIADRVLRGETVNDAFENAAVMFMDMVGFTTMSSEMDPNDVVKLLSEIFTVCDALMNEHGLMKIKTIGDSYMAVSFSRTDGLAPNTQHVVSAAGAAVEVLQTLSVAHPDISVRIGLHCGPVTAGVIGTERLQYDVWGDTVNVASRMESSGEPGRVHVSETFATLLNDTMTNDSMTLSKRGTIDVKGKGLMTTYWLEG